ICVRASCIASSHPVCTAPSIPFLHRPSRTSNLHESLAVFFPVQHSSRFLLLRRASRWVKWRTSFCSRARARNRQSCFPRDSGFGIANWNLRYAICLLKGLQNSRLETCFPLFVYELLDDDA